VRQPAPPCKLASIAVTDYGEELVGILPAQFHGSTSYRELATADYGCCPFGQAHVVQVSGHRCQSSLKKHSVWSPPTGVLSATKKTVPVSSGHQGDAAVTHSSLTALPERAL